MKETSKVTKNSAHEDIKILVEQSSDDYQSFLKMVKSRVGGEDILNILKIIEELADTEQTDIKFHKQTLKFFTENKTHSVYFKTLQVEGEKERVIDSSATDLLSNIGANLTKEDLSNIEDGNYDLLFYLGDPPPPYSLSELLKEMAIFEIGRPSNYANVINELIESELIQLTKHGLELTIDGKEIIDILQQEEPFLASELFCKPFNEATNLVASGLVSYEKAINTLFEKTFHSPPPKQSFWTSIEELYLDEEQEKEYVGGLTGKE